MEKQPRNNKLFSNSRRNVTEKKEVRKRVFSVFLRRGPRVLVVAKRCPVAYTAGGFLNTDRKRGRG